MSHAGRRIASAAAATAAIAVPVVAAASAQADSLPVVGGLPVVGSIAGQSLPLSGIPVAGGVLSGPLSGLPVVGSLAAGLAQQAQAAAPQSLPMQQAPAVQAPTAAQVAKQGGSTVQSATHHYTPKHAKAGA